LAVKLPFPVPEEGVSVHQAWLETAVHKQPAVTEKLVDPAAEVTDLPAGEAPRVQVVDTLT